MQAILANVYLRCYSPLACSRLKAESDVDRQNALLNLSAQVVRAAASPGIHSLQRLNVSLPAKKAEPKSAIDRLVDRVSTTSSCLFITQSAYLFHLVAGRFIPS